MSAQAEGSVVRVEKWSAQARPRAKMHGRLIQDKVQYRSLRRFGPEYMRLSAAFSRCMTDAPLQKLGPGLAGKGAGLGCFRGVAWDSLGLKAVPWTWPDTRRPLARGAGLASRPR